MVRANIDLATHFTSMNIHISSHKNHLREVVCSLVTYSIPFILFLPHGYPTGVSYFDTSFNLAGKRLYICICTYIPYASLEPDWKQQIFQFLLSVQE